MYTICMYVFVTSALIYIDPYGSNNSLHTFDHNIRTIINMGINIYVEGKACIANLRTSASQVVFQSFLILLLLIYVAILHFFPIYILCFCVSKNYFPAKGIPCSIPMLHVNAKVFHNVCSVLCFLREECQKKWIKM